MVLKLYHRLSGLARITKTLRRRGESDGVSAGNCAGGSELESEKKERVVWKEKEIWKPGFISRLPLLNWKRDDETS